MPNSTVNASAPGSEPSIIEIIQNMVREGESEEKIVQTLQQLGVEPKKAQRLLLLAQADTFALLRSEISKIVKQDVDAEKQGLNVFVQQQAHQLDRRQRGVGVVQLDRVAQAQIVQAGALAQMARHDVLH